MEILINDRKIQYQLEGEESLGEVLAGLERWIAENRNVIMSLTVDRAPVAPERLDSLGQRISKVGTVEIRTQSCTQLASESLEALQEYLQYLDLLLRGDVVENHDAVLEGLDMTVEALDRSLGMLGVNPAVVYAGGPEGESSLEQALGELRRHREELTRRYITGGDAGELRRILDRLRPMFSRVLGWALLKENLSGGGEPDRAFLGAALKDLYLAAQGRAGVFEEIGEHLQVGRDQQAFQRLASFLEFFHELLILVSRASAALQPGSEDMRALLGEIRGVLKEVEQAMERGDLVCVGDLLEYELRERYLHLLEVLESLRSMAGKEG